MHKLRAFIALPVRQEVIEALVGSQRSLVERNPRADVRWTNPATIHLTLFFIGDILESQVESVGQILGEAVRGLSPITFWLHHVEALPDTHHPKIITARVWEDGREAKK